MTKVAPDALIDAELDYIIGCDRQIACSQAPASYAEATATYDLATARMLNEKGSDLSSPLKSTEWRPKDIRSMFLWRK